MQRQAPYTSTRWALGHAVTLTFDLLTPNMDAFVLFPQKMLKCINVESW